MDSQQPSTHQPIRFRATIGFYYTWRPYINIGFNPPPPPPNSTCWTWKFFILTVSKLWIPTLMELRFYLSVQVSVSVLCSCLCLHVNFVKLISRITFDVLKCCFFGNVSTFNVYFCLKNPRITFKLLALSADNFSEYNSKGGRLRTFCFSPFINSRTVVNIQLFYRPIQRTKSTDYFTF